MTKTERRFRDFSSGMKKLSNGSQNYIHKLAHILFLVEQPPVCPILEKKFPELKEKICMVGLYKDKPSGIHKGEQI